MKPAGFWIRAAAFLIDFLLINSIEFGVMYGSSRLMGLDPFTEQIWDLILTLIAYGSYYGIYQVRAQTSVGKKLLKLRILDSRTGGAFSRTQSLGRTAAYLVSAIVLGCGFLMVLFHPEKRSLHDLLGRTLVVHDEA